MKVVKRGAKIRNRKEAKRENRHEKGEKDEEGCRRKGRREERDVR